MTTKRDHKGLVHVAKRATSVFSECSAKHPTMEDFTVALAFGTNDEDGMVTCLMCIGGRHDQG